VSVLIGSTATETFSVRSQVKHSNVPSSNPRVLAKFAPRPSCACTPDTLADRRSHHSQPYPRITGKTVLADLYLSRIGKRVQAPLDPLEQRERKPVGLSGRAEMRGLRGSTPSPPKPPKAGLRTDRDVVGGIVLPVRDRSGNPAVDGWTSARDKLLW
jgi:hypothetical protein